MLSGEFHLRLNKILNISDIVTNGYGKHGSSWMIKLRKMEVHFLCAFLWVFCHIVVPNEPQVKEVP